jgi:hypothetical protein
MQSSEKFTQTEAVPNSLRVVGSLFFIIGGLSLILMCFLGAAPSLWYFVSFCSFPLIGILWLRKTRLASALAFGPIIPLALMLRHSPGMIEFSRISALCLAAGLISAIALLVVSLRGHNAWFIPALLSCCFVASAFVVDKRFTNKVSTKTYEMHVALDGRAPWGEVGPEAPDGTAPIVLYRPFGRGYCYDAFQSDELRRRLIAEHPQTVTIVYNIFSDFGRERSFNVRSVDGVQLAEGQSVLREWQGGQIMGEGEITSTSTDWCH